MRLSTAGAAAAATGYCGLPGATVPAAAAPPRPSSGLLNELRLQAGKSTLGSLNPLIDANAASFNDVTTGSSSGSCAAARASAASSAVAGALGAGAPASDPSKGKGWNECAGSASSPGTEAFAMNMLVAVKPQSKISVVSSAYWCTRRAVFQFMRDIMITPATASR